MSSVSSAFSKVYTTAGLCVQSSCNQFEVTLWILKTFITMSLHRGTV